MSKIKETRRQGWLTILAIAIIGIAVYLGFTPLYALVPDGVPKAVISSSFGAIFVIVLTMYLLNKQTEIEQESKRGERVFDEKVKLYQSILTTLEDIIKDDQITKAEFSRLPFPMMRVQMLGGDDTIEAFERIYQQLNAIFERDEENDEVEINEEEKESLHLLISRFASHCRKDLGISDHEVKEEVIKKTVDTIQKSSGKRARDMTKFTYDGKALLRSKYVLSVIKDWEKNNTNASSKDLEQILPSIGATEHIKRYGPAKGQWAYWNTYDYAIERHHSKYFTDKKDVLNLSDGKFCVRKTAILTEDVLELIKIWKEKGLKTE
tara:strand:- start:83 stop:1048 length:966 start_codon:yes stop_codon:yes gene_type:complete